VARTFAKAWGAAGLRVGYAVAHPGLFALLHKLRPDVRDQHSRGEFMSRMLDHTSKMMQSVARINDGKRFFENRMSSSRL